MVKSC